MARADALENALVTAMNTHAARQALVKGVTDAGARQGLTLDHFPAQLERFLWDRGCAWGLFSPCEGGV